MSIHEASAHRPVWSPSDAYHITKMRSNLRRVPLESVKNYDANTMV
ncbi:MAG: hypothetical protein QXE37_04760 [Nitrososphaerales archaeon]